MTPELTALALAILLQGLQLLLMAVPANLELGPRTTMSPRDDGPLTDKASVLVGRLSRALDNHSMALTLFAPAVFLVVLTDSSSAWTAGFAYGYLIARLLYVPAYAFGLQPWRSVVYVIGFMATMALVISVLI